MYQLEENRDPKKFLNIFYDFNKYGYSRSYIDEKFIYIFDGNLDIHLFSIENTLSPILVNIVELSNKGIVLETFDFNIFLKLIINY